MIKPIVSGPSPCKLMVIGEKCGHKEVAERRPMVGGSGAEFDRMLSEAGLNRSDVFITNVAHEYFAGDGFLPVGKSKKEGRERVKGKYPCDAILRGLPLLPELIERVNPDIIIAAGAVPLWALTDKIGITKWRGSLLEYEGRKLIPTFNPANLFSNWSTRWPVVQDLRRVAFELLRENPREIVKTERNYLVRPTLDEVIDFLEKVKGQLVAVDIETRGGHIDCLGIALNKHDAICIPLMSVEKPEGYWTLEDEITIVLALREALTHPETRCIGHNFQFDAQYIAADLGFCPNVSDDTMIMQHTCYPGMRKSLDFVASLVCNYYCFWKDEGKQWDPRIHTEEQHWNYNCDDCTYTFECKEALDKALDTYKLRGPYEFQMSLFMPVLRMMLRGILIDQDERNRLNGVLLRKISETSQWFETALGHPLNPDDNHAYGQMRKLFYHDLGITPEYHRKTKAPTLDKDALERLKEREPILRPLIEKVEEYRSYRVFRSNFILKEIDPDGRMRSTISIPGAETFRFSSSENPWGRGANLQTIPKGTEDD